MFQNKKIKLDEATSKGKSLLDIPQLVQWAGKHYTGSFSCNNNQLTSLEGAPASVGGSFSCSYNKLTSLEGAPSSVGGDLRCNNQLTSLEGVHHHIHKIGGQFHCSVNRYILDIFLVEGVNEFKSSNDAVDAIVNKYLPLGKKRMVKAGLDLIDAGLGQYARKTQETGASLTKV